MTVSHDSFYSLLGEQTHVRVNLRGWKNDSVVSTSVRVGTDPTALIDTLESVDLQCVWGSAQPIVSVDGSAKIIPLIRKKVPWIIQRVLNASVLLPWTLANVASVKRHWDQQRQELRSSATLRLMEIETDRANLKAQIKEAESKKAPRLHLRNQLAKLENEALALGGKAVELQEGAKS